MTELSKNAQVPQCDKTAVMQSVILPNELRIGNLVGYKFGENEIYAIRSFDEEYVSLKDNISFDYIGYDEINPLEITPFMLEKLGFKKCEFNIPDKYKKENCSFSIKYRKENGYTVEYKYGHVYLKSIHQLQNLYFALTARELTVA